MRDLRRKLLSLGNHFFERLKTANFSTACGTSTLKSLPSRAFFVSDVHLRPRKHFSRCTLDCGFKTSESPALRGFVGGLRALATAALYLVLLSNGFPYSKIRLKKFDFSPIDTPANIAKKLPSQRCSQPFLIAFSTSRTNGPCSLLQAKAGTHSAFRERSHTRAHAPKQGAFRMGVVSLLSERSARSPTSPGRVSERQVLPLLGLGRGCSQRTQRAFGTAMRLCASLFRGVAAPLGCVIFFRFCRNCGLYALFQILLSVLQTLQLVPFLCKLRLSSFLFGSEFNGFRSKQAGFFAIILENV